MSMDEGDNLSAIVRVPRDETDGQPEDESGDSNQPDGEAVSMDTAEKPDAKSDATSDPKPDSKPDDSNQVGPAESSDDE